MTQLKLLDRQLREEHFLELFPINLPKTAPADFDQSKAISMQWHVNRYWRWLLSKRVVRESQRLSAFLSDAMFGTDYHWGPEVITEFKLIMESFRRFFGSPEASFNVALQTRVLDTEIAELTDLVKELHERLAFIESLESAYERNAAWRRCHAKALEDVSRSISDLSQLSLSSTAVLAEDFHGRIERLRDLTDSVSGRVYDEVGLVWRLQAKETQKAMAFLHFWPSRLKELDEAITASAVIDPSDMVIVEDAKQRLELARLRFETAKEACKEELVWFLEQADDEIFTVLDDVREIEIGSAVEMKDLLE